MLLLIINIIASNAKIGKLEAELGSGHDDKGNILTDAQKAQRREELRAEISHRDELSAKITTEATNEFVNRQNIDVNANGTTVEQRKQTIIDAQTKIEEHQHNITELREQYELDKANLDVSHQAIASSYQTKANEMAERHRTETLEDRANVQKAKDDYQAPIDQAKADLDAHNKNIKAENDAKAVNKAQFDKSKKEAERLAAERLDGRYRRRPRIPRGGNHGGTI